MVSLVNLFGLDCYEFLNATIEAPIILWASGTSALFLPSGLPGKTPLTALFRRHETVVSNPASTPG
jgi:hypothetical protein